MNNILKIGREILIQIIPVAIGVYLGLIVNDWNSNRQAQDRKSHSRELLIQEIKTNKTKIEEALEYHQMLLDSIGSRMKKDTLRFKDLSFWQGVRTPTLYSGAYQSATLSNTLNSFELPEIHSIVEAYSAQQKYDNMSLVALQGLVQQDFYNEESLKQTMSFITMMLTDLYYAEKDLMVSYTKALEVLEE